MTAVAALKPSQSFSTSPKGRFTVSDAKTPVKVTARLLVRARAGAAEDMSCTSVMPLKSDPALAYVMFKLLQRERATHLRVRKA
jgi:hypothetical protein